MQAAMNSTNQIGYIVGLTLLATMGALLNVIMMQIMPVVVPSSHVHPGEHQPRQESLLHSQSEQHAVNRDQNDFEEITHQMFEDALKQPSTHEKPQCVNKGDRSLIGREYLLLNLMVGAVMPMLVYLLP